MTHALAIIALAFCAGMMDARGWPQKAAERAEAKAQRAAEKKAKKTPG